MKYLRTTLLALAVLFVLSAAPAFLHADAPGQVGTSDPLPIPTDPDVLDASIPPLVGGSPYPFPITTYELPAAAELSGPDAPTAPNITVWYGNSQSFGQKGTPQEWINITGNVVGATSLTYSLNDGPDKPLTIGSTADANPPRLAAAGDFNIELRYTDLKNGANKVVIKATDGATADVETVTVNYAAGNTWSLPYTTNWGSAANVHEQAQPVDGKWIISGGRLVTDLPGYDRLAAIGSMTWTDYEVEVPVLVESIDPSINSSGVGMIVRWQGHFDNDGNNNPDDQNPKMGWRRLGALAWYRWTPSGRAAFEMMGNGGQNIASRSDEAIELNKEYIFKLSVQSSTFAGNTATYRFKYWPAGTPEPQQWFLTAPGRSGEPASGSVVLVAHQAKVFFGNAKITPIQNKTFSVNVQQPANGEIIVTPPPNPVTGKYEYGQTVEIRVQGQGNYVLQNWTGSFSGTQNPLIFDITNDVTVGAEMVTGTRPKLTVTATGEGSVDAAPQRANGVYAYGEEVTLTPKPKLGYIFAGWSGDLTGADNPAVIVMDKAKTIVANFVQSNPNSPISDDFSSCGLNTDLWTFENPVGDGSYSTNGTQLLLNVPADTSHNIWNEGNRSVRVMQATQNVNFEIITKFDSAVTQRYQMQGILVEQNPNNFLRFETHYEGSSVKLYVARFVDGSPTALINNVLLNATPSYLRVTRVGPIWGFSFSHDGETWEAGGSFTHDMTVTRSGVFGANHGTPNAPAHTAIVDYFFNTAKPIVPEDGGTPGTFTVTVNKVGQGNVTLSPAKTSYACGEKVTLSAAPANGWSFAGWSGDLSGAAPSQQLTVTRNHTITATFTQGPVERKLFLPIVVR